MRHALMFKAFDVFALGGTRDWSSEFQMLYKNLGQQYEQKQKEQDLQRIPNTKPSLALTEYAGKYASDLYGEIIVTTDGNSLNLAINNVVNAKLDHWHYDTFSGWYDKRWWGKTKVQFKLNAAGRATTLEVEGMEFTRVP